MNTVLVIHGWPSPIEKGSKLFHFLENRGFRVVAPYYLGGDSFDIDETIKFLEASLNKQKPVLIIGISMGGLIMPYIARKYPDAKLVFIATGMRFQPSLKRLVWGVNLVRGKGGRLAFELVKKTPAELVSRMGFWASHGIKKASFTHYAAVAKTNRNNLLKMNPQVAVDVANFLYRVNTLDTIRELGNKTAVVVSRDDVQMPEKLGQELCDNLRNGILIRTQGSHFKILNDEVLHKLNNFV